MKHPLRYGSWAAALLLTLTLAVLSGCDATDTGGGGRVRVLLTDAPLDGIAEAFVTIERVELIDTDGEVVVLMDDEQAFDLLLLRNGVTAPLAELEIPEGAYDQLRIIVDEEATLRLEDGSTSRLKIPSGSTSGIKVQVPRFVIDGDEDEVRIVVDFDASRSFVRAGNGGKYIFKPVIKVESFEMDDDDQDIDDDEEIDGRIETIGTDFVVVDGRRFLVDTRTDFKGLAGLAALAIGMEVEVEFMRLDDGTLLAVEIEREDD
jgi:hypothetical protein